ncbi:Oxygen-independent coproporphyrinogen-III oxidase [compost metagenome]
MIQQLICHFQLDFAAIEQAFDIDFHTYFASVWPELQHFADDGLIRLSDTGIDVTAAGRLLVRSICMLFDHYLPMQNIQRFSRVI